MLALRFELKTQRRIAYQAESMFINQIKLYVLLDAPFSVGRKERVTTWDFTCLTGQEV